MRKAWNKIYLSEKNKIKEIIKSRCDITDYCWNWTGSVKEKRHPYGVIGIEGKKYSTHRVSYFLYNNDFDLNDSKIEICHKCDNPRCVNPDHLFKATHVENIRDCHRKGRAYKFYGIKSPNVKLTEEQVKYIRKFKNKQKTYKQTACEFGVSTQTVWRIATNKSWKHLI